jgi:hypothetical protein
MTNIDPAGVPIIGANQAYKTDSLVTISVGLEYEDGEEVILKNGAGRICMNYQAPSTLKRGTVSDFQICTPDPNILQFAMGGDVIEIAAVAEVQTATITGTPTGGTFTLTYNGQTTGPIAYNAVFGVVQTALLAGTELDTGDVVVSGGPGPGTPYVFTFNTDLGNPALMTASGAGLTGGTAPTVAVTTTTPGTDLPTAIGYRAPEVGSDPKPNGLGLEFWTNAMSDGAVSANLPYLHWVMGRAKLRPTDAWKAGAEDAMTPAFEGFTEQNRNFGDGPVGDWPYPSDRVWQWARVATLPDLSPGFLEVTV